jgi:OmpA-OmpF porin, OOP family
MAGRTHVWLAGVMMLASGAAAAQTNSYMSVKGGVGSPQDVDVGAGAPQRRVEYKEGYIVLGAVGKTHGAWRYEVEGQYQQHEVEGATNPNTGVSLAGAKGEASLLAGMANAYYGFDTGGRLTPYVGAGVGIGHLKYDNYRTDAGRIIDDETTALVYQGMLGLDYLFIDRWSLTGEYRYLSTAGVDTNELSSGTKQDSDFQVHTLMLGLTYRF